MKTRSETASSDSGLSAIAYGGDASEPASPMTTRLGPSTPMCNQTLAEPGPPLNANVTGRVVGSASSAA
jgi:hypothetical protein